MVRLSRSIQHSSNNKALSTLAKRALGIGTSQNANATLRCVQCVVDTLIPPRHMQSNSLSFANPEGSGSSFTSDCQ